VYIFAKSLKFGSLAIILIVYIVLGFISISTLNIHKDEKESHLPTLETFCSSDLLTAVESNGYKSASTPLPYFIVSLPLKIFSAAPSLLYARIFNMLISLAVLFVFIMLCGENKTSPVYFALTMLFYPYYLKPSFAFFMSIYGLLFFILFIFYERDSRTQGRLISGLFLALAVLCRQFYLIVFAFYIVRKLYEEYFTQTGPRSLKSIYLFITPFIIPLLLFFIWGGSTHPNYKTWGIGFSIENITGVLVTVGSALLPYTLLNLKKIKTSVLTVLFILSSLLVLLYYPVWNNSPNTGEISGFTFKILAYIKNYSVILSFILKTFLCLLGLSSFYLLIKAARTGKLKFLLFLFITLAVGFTLNRLPSERHLLPLIATAYLLIFNLVEKKSILKYFMAYSVVIGSVYFYYIMFLYRI
jgi:hypothetical protein